MVVGVKIMVFKVVSTCSVIREVSCALITKAAGSSEMVDF